jgi:hypothetical protein
MIRVTLDAAAVGEGAAAALPPITAEFRSGEVTLLATEGGNRPTVLSLVASGRMKLDAGSVAGVWRNYVGTERRLTDAELRRAVALVDTPLVAEHSDDVSVATVIHEEFALTSGRSRGKKPAPHAHRRPFGSLAAAERLRLLVDLTLVRSGVEALVITSPERHGGDPADWFGVAQEAAERGTAVLVITNHATVDHLDRLFPALESSAS